MKGGGHATNPGFSSTTGVQITMSRFGEVTYNETDQTVIIGAGLIWDDVYAVLEKYNRTVLGGRVSGIGVAGFVLGGGTLSLERKYLSAKSGAIGYSWKTNQYGLSVDSVVAYELVKPDGSILNVTWDSQPDLFFGLKVT